MMITNEWLRFMREQFPAGTRIQLHELNKPDAGLCPGMTGLLTEIDDTGSFHVKWDNGSTTGLVVGQDLSERTDAQKLLRKLSGNTAENAVESQTLMLLNRLIARPELIRSAPQKTVSIEEMELQRELDALMQVLPVDEERASELAVRLAAAQYNRLGPEEYETERLKWLLQKREPMKELDAGLLKTCLSRVEVTGVSVRLWLKNGQCIERNPSE